MPVEQIHNEDIIKYYKAYTKQYRIFWSTRYLRYGIWDSQTKSLREALANTDRLVADSLNLIKVDTVFDAGSGFGGSAAFFAKNFHARIFGVDLSGDHIKIDRHQAAREGVDHLVEFRQEDYAKTSFAEEFFSKAYAVESFYHSPDPQTFLDEAFRVLKTGGRLAIVDRFLSQDFPVKDAKANALTYLKGKAVKTLCSISTVDDMMRKAGFKNVLFIDKLETARKGIDRVARLRRLTYPLSYLLHILRIVPKEAHRHSQSFFGVEGLFKSGAMTYGIFLAEK